MVTDILKDYSLILASASPRRRQLLSEAGISFRSAEVLYNEITPEGLNGREIAEYLAEGKAESWKKRLRSNQILITADTVVWCRGTHLAKPADHAEAYRFLQLLSGCTHEVITGICLKSRERKYTFSVTTAVTFGHLDDDEINYYINHFKPFDKAGAYGIQEWIGLRGITRIDGSYYNVMGMPVSDLLIELVKFITD